MDASAQRSPREPETRRLPDWLVVTVVLLSAAPGLLILAGVDLGVDADTGDSQFVHVGDRMRLHLLLQGSFLHTILEWSCVSIGVLYAAFCLLDYRLREDRTVLVLGFALLCAAVTDAFHILAADRVFLHVSDNAQFIPLTWALSRMVNALVLACGMGLILWVRREDANRNRYIWVFGATALLLAFVSSWISAVSSSLPVVQFEDTLVKRPYDLMPLLLYALLLPALGRTLDRAEHNYISHSLLLALVPAVMTQVHMAFGSTSLFDAHFNAGHFLKAVSYLVPFCGLYAEYGHMASKLRLREAALADQASVLAQANKRLYREISEREQAEKSLRQHAEQLRVNNEELEQFAFIASHDLREPLRKILIFTSRLERSPLINEDTRVREMVDTVASASQRMMELLESLQRYSQFSGQAAVRTDVALADLIQEVVNMLSPLVEESGARLVVERLPTLRNVDAEQMQHLFQHLLQNALTYITEEDVPEVRISELPGATPGMTSICVEDNGPGIDPRYQEKVFQIFQRLERDPNSSSTGVGLTLCRRICHRHGGDLRLESTVGSGSRFIVELPQ